MEVYTSGHPSFYKTLTSIAALPTTVVYTNCFHSAYESSAEIAKLHRKHNLSLKVILLLIGSIFIGELSSLEVI